jgi:hypothetical protein
MPTYRDRQTSFAGGEFSPDLWGRTDFAKYETGCKGLLNFFVTPQGSLANRPGTRCIQAVGSWWFNPLGEGKIRIVPFVFSDTDSVLLLFAEYKIGVWKYDSSTGFVLQATPSPALVTPYTSAHISELNFCQIGDVIVITHPEHAPYELTRLNSACTSWSFEEIDFEVAAFPAYGGGDPAILLRGAVRRPEGDSYYDWTTSGMTIPVEEDSAHPSRNWQWCVTRIMQSAGGHVYETLPVEVNTTRRDLAEEWSENGFYGIPPVTGWIGIPPGAPTGRSWVYVTDDATLENKWYKALQASGPWMLVAPHKPVSGGDSYWSESTDVSWSGWENVGGAGPDSRWVLYPDRTVIITWKTFPPHPEATPSGSDRIIATRIYRGRGGRYGFVGETSGSDFEDDGATPDFSLPPPSGVHPFRVLNVDGVTVDRTEYPSLCAHFEGRRFFASTTYRPSTVWASAVEQYDNLDEVVPSPDDRALSFELASNRLEQIRALVARQHMMVLTDSSEWLISGSGQAEVLTPNSIACRPLSEHGSGALSPLSFGDCLVFVQRKGTVPRCLRVNDAGLQMLDVSTLSRHLFVGKTIGEWCYSEDPWSQIWVVQSDGSLLCCTFVLEHELVAWSRHEIAGGTVESIASIPEGTEDAIYMIVRRNGLSYLERLNTRVVTDIREGIFLDGSVSFDGRNTDEDFTTTVVGTGGSLGQTPGDEVSVTFVGESVAGQNLNQTIRVYSDDESESFDVLLTSHTGASVYVGELTTAMLADLDGVATYHWAVCVSSVAIPSYGTLGQEFSALLDGNVTGPLIENGGRVAFESPAAVGCVGLSYNCDFESLDMATEKGRQRIVKSVCVEITESRSGYVGPSLSDADLEQIPVREVKHEYEAIPTKKETMRTIVPGSWDENGRTCYRQSDPLPVTLVGITREVEFGG